MSVITKIASDELSDEVKDNIGDYFIDAFGQNYSAATDYHLESLGYDPTRKNVRGLARQKLRAEGTHPHVTSRNYGKRTVPQMFDHQDALTGAGLATGASVGGGVGALAGGRKMEGAAIGAGLAGTAGHQLGYQPSERTQYMWDVDYDKQGPIETKKRDLNDHSPLMLGAAGGAAGKVIGEHIGSDPDDDKDRSRLGAGIGAATGAGLGYGAGHLVKHYGIKRHLDS